MPALIHLATALLASGLPTAWAGDLQVVSVGAPVVVVRDGLVVGTTPVTLRGLAAGSIEIGFRESPLSATAFTQAVTAPATGLTRLEVNLPERLATVPVAAPPPAPPAASPPPAAPAAAPSPPVVPAAPAAPPLTAAPSGDLYITSTPAGAAIFLDGAEVGEVTPVVLRGLPVGAHAVEARTRCGRASASATVSAGTITRSELVLEEKPGSLVVTGGAPGSRVFLDGVEVGKAPFTLKQVSCGQHAVAIRAPGYLESTGTVSVLGGEPLNLVVTTAANPAPSPAPAGRTTQMFLRKEEFGTLVLDVTPLETPLKVDGVDVGAGPRSISKIATGPHTVSGQLGGYEPLSVQVTVEPDTITRANLKLVAVAHAPRKEADGPSAGRLALNVGVSVAGLGASAYGVSRYLVAREAYVRYQSAASDVAAEGIFAEEVEPARRSALVAGGVGLLGLGAATGLWIKTEF